LLFCNRSRGSDTGHAIDILDSRLYRWLETFSNFLFLNLLWLLACLPVVTIYPATAAMFGVVRGWVRKKEDGLLQTFLACFKENFKQSFVIGLVWTFLGFVLLLDFYLINQASSGPGVVLGSLLFLAVILYVFTSLYLFPVMVHYEASWPVVLKTSLLLSVGQLSTTVLCLLVVAVMVGISFFAPVSLLVTGSLTAYIVYWLCDRAFRKVVSISGRD
jgi:uncharacterized membrane protein YesL